MTYKNLFALMLIVVFALAGCSSDKSTVAEPQANAAAPVVHSSAIGDATARAAVATLPTSLVAAAKVIAVTETSEGLVVAVQRADADDAVSLFTVDLFAGTATPRLVDKRSDLTPCDVYMMQLMQCLNSCIGAPYCYEWCVSGLDGC